MNHSTYNDSLESERLFIEPLTPGHAEQLFESFCDPELYHYIFWNIPESVDWLKERYKVICRGYSKDGKQIWLNWASKCKHTQEYSGFFEATIVDDCVMLAYYTFQPFQKKGLAKEGVKTIMQHLQKNYPVKKFIIEMDTRNRASVRLAESLGFVWEKTTNNVCELKGFQSHEFTYVFDLEPQASILVFSEIMNYVTFQYPDLSDAEKISKAKDIEQQYFNASSLEKIFIMKQADEIIATARLLTLQPHVFGLANVNIRTAKSRCKVFDKLLEAAKDYCISSNAFRIEYRLLESSESEQFVEILLSHGFEYKHKRIEYQQAIDVLANDIESPIQWIQAESLNEETLFQLAEVLIQASEGDPDFNPDDKPVELIKAYMQENQLTHGVQCIHVGKIDNMDAAIVIAQVNQQTGWSRITYMGLLPQFRGKGLGQWVHRHGFRMMQEQGGTLYHGGTLEKNLSMICLFEKHGCKKFREVQEWEYRI